MATFVIPVTPEPSQEFTIDLDNQTVKLSFRWNATIGQWVMDLLGITFTQILNGIPLVTGVDLLLPYAVRELGQLWVLDLEEKDAEPDFDNFGDRYQILYVER